MINDDRPAIRFDGGQPILYGTPWSGKSNLNHNIHAPLTAVVFLEQAPENRLERLSPADAYFGMATGVVRPLFDEALGTQMLDAVERVLNTVPMYRLSCTISREAVQLVYQEILGGILP